MRNAVTIPRPALALVVAATVALGGCVEKRTVYRDNDDRRPRYSWNDDRDDDWFRPGRRVGRGVICNDDRNVCYKNGWPNHDVTRKVFGKRAGRAGRWG
jgi:hypothetical protein